MSLPTTNWNYEFFKSHEFDSGDRPGTGLLMQPGFMSRLVEARRISAVPYNINSGYRTASHNRKIKGAKNSAHLRGWAADIAFSSQDQFLQIIKGLTLAGFNRIGVSSTFIHADCDPALTAYSVWVYDKTNVMQLNRRGFVEGVFAALTWRY